MFPTILDFGHVPIFGYEFPLRINSYGLMIGLGVLTALWLLSRDARNRGFSPEVVQGLVGWTVVAGLIGTRIAYIMMFPDRFSWTRPIEWFEIWSGGLVFQGALPAGLLAGLIYLRIKGMSFWKTADLVFPYLPLGQAFGRIGCFLYGCCYGKPTDIPWGVSFPPGSQPAARYPAELGDHGVWSAHLHPTQLYSSFGLVGLFLLLLYIRKKWRPFDGVMLPAYLVLYSAFRFSVEFLRGDNIRYFSGALTEQQLYSIAIAAAGLVLFGAMAMWKASSRRLEGKD